MKWTSLPQSPLAVYFTNTSFALGSSTSTSTTRYSPGLSKRTAALDFMTWHPPVGSQLEQTKTYQRACCIWVARKSSAMSQAFSAEAAL